MTETELSVRALLSSQRALLGAITPNVRLVTIGWDGLKLLKLKAYFDAEPSEDDKDEIEAVSAEILADIPFERDQVECAVSNEPKSRLEVYKHVVYSRKE